MNILFITTEQFGYQTDYLKYAQYLRQENKITFISVNQGLPIIELDRVTVYYFNKKKQWKIVQYANFFRFINKIINDNCFDLIFVKYYISCSLISISKKNRIINLDIRSGNISSNSVKRKLSNLIMNSECKFFEHISIIGENLRKYLRIPKRKTVIIPIGGEKYNKQRIAVHKNPINIVYVGTFTNRNITKTIEGFKLFLDATGIDATYTIVGYGNKKETFMILNMVKKLNLGDKVSYVGRVNNDELHHFYEKADIGISFIPVTKYYDVQPPTKTFEYLSAGIPCLATNTIENSNIINKYNGVLCGDTATGVCNGLAEIYERLNQFNSIQIQNSIKGHNWDAIVNFKLLPYLRSLWGGCK